MRCCLRLLCGGLALLIASPAMPVCNVPQPRRVCAEYFASQIVVEADLIQIRALHDKDDPQGISSYSYTLSINQVIRGKIKGSIHVYESNDSGRATFEWAAGRKYLLFLWYEARDKSWELDGCGNSGPLTGAEAALSEIKVIKARHDLGKIHGLVTKQNLSTPFPGVHIEARGSKGRYTAMTDEEGEFRINVPPGKYIVRAVENPLSFQTADFSYEDPRRIRIEPGGCVQVQLIGFERPFRSYSH